MTSGSYINRGASRRIQVDVPTEWFPPHETHAGTGTRNALETDKSSAHRDWFSGAGAVGLRGRGLLVWLSPILDLVDLGADLPFRNEKKSCGSVPPALVELRSGVGIVVAL